MDNTTKLHAPRRLLTPPGPRYWRSLSERIRKPDFSLAAHREFADGDEEPVPVPADAVSRRRFLGLMSASAALAAGTVACSKPDRGTIVPYTKRPEEILPGVANYYASTFAEGLDTHGVLVKTREGRPIHVEGNDEHPLARGKAPLRAIADILRLYDGDRLRRPMIDGKDATWTDVDAKVVPALKAAGAGTKDVLLLMGPVLSPTRRALVEEIKRVVPRLRVVAWEPAVGDGELIGLRALHDAPLRAVTHLDRAKVVVSFEHDFLAGAVPALVRDFTSGRKRGAGAFKRLWALESGLSVTGAKADERLQVKPSQAARVGFALARLLADKHGLALPAGLEAGALTTFAPSAIAEELGVDVARIEALAADLAQAGRASVVLAGSSLAPEAHAAVHLLNAMTGAEGHTVDVSTATELEPLATWAELATIVKGMGEGAFSAAIFWGVNPAYLWPDADAWKAAVAKVPLRVRISLHADETAEGCDVVLPERHWLESWGDFEPALGLLSLQQPAVGPLYDDRQGEEILLGWARALGVTAPEDYHGYLMARWRKDVWPQGRPVSFEIFWTGALHDGVFRRSDLPPRPARTIKGAIVGAAAAQAAKKAGAGAGEGLELLLRPGYGLYDGRYANIGWLQELPDPITKCTWTSAALVSLADATALGLDDGDLVKLEAGGKSLEVPVIVQPGQCAGAVTFPLGYGRRSGAVGKGVGQNGFALVDMAAGGSPLARGGAKLTKLGNKVELPLTQAHHKMEGRDLVRSFTLAEFEKKLHEPTHGDPHGAEHDDPIHTASLYEKPTYADHRWGMVIDLGLCTGCSGCVVGCQSENNVPVVGPEQVTIGREMHWIRIDRYYEGKPEDPKVVHSPTLCQHCENAPCENVCPVNATNHSPDGLNQMAYNRCVGTRYCANNCPYKVRRFNYFEFTAFKREPELLVFNPEVTVRPRGVIEKCSFCVQRINDARMRARVDGRPLQDGDIKTACQVACPADAIIFGDLLDPASAVSKAAKDTRGYTILSHLGVRPSITYLAHISNPATTGAKGA